MRKKFEDVALVLNPQHDNVAVAKAALSAGLLLTGPNEPLRIGGTIRRGGRFALRDIRRGQPVRQFGYPFGMSKGIRRGEAVSSENVENALPETSRGAFCAPPPTAYRPQYIRRTFSGYQRPDGRVGTRNYYLVVPTSMCASETALQLARRLDNAEEIAGHYPNIDGIVAVPHTEGCGCAANEQIERVLRVLRGFVEHPNVGGCLIMDLGCEQTNYQKVHEYLARSGRPDQKPVDWITIQESGGIRKTLATAFARVRQRLPEVNSVRRVPSPVERLVVGTECGASDSFSGITANPVMGNAADRIVYGKGSVILSEVPEMIGTLNVLWPRFRRRQVADQFQAAIDWYVALAHKLGVSLEDNLVPENKEGGLINVFIKSLGAVMKGGTTAIEDVVDYGASLRTRGLSIMQGPGGDLESVTGLVAAGATVICFSTGKGASSGSAICPVIKIAATDELARKLPEDMDFNAGRLLTQHTSVAALGAELFEKILQVAGGAPTCSETLKQRQFQIWTAGKLSL